MTTVKPSKSSVGNLFLSTQEASIKLWVAPPSIKAMAHCPWILPLILIVWKVGTPVRVAIVALRGNCSSSVLCSSPFSFYSDSSSSLLSGSTSMRCTFPLPIHLWPGTQGSLQAKHKFFLLKSHHVSSFNHFLYVIILSLFSGRWVAFSLFSRRLVVLFGCLFFGTEPYRSRALLIASCNVIGL